MTPRENFELTAALMGAEASPVMVRINDAMGWPDDALPLRSLARGVADIVEREPESFELIADAFAALVAEYRGFADLLERCQRAQPDENR